MKTLKDIERMSFQTKRGIHEDTLRQVAREWIKLWEDKKRINDDFNKKTNTLNIISGIQCKTFTINQNVINAFKHFFNLEGEI